MEFSSTAIALTILSVLLGLLLVCGLVWLMPIFIQRQRAYIKRKIVQKKANEEMVKNVRYRSPSTVGGQQPMSKGYDYGSTQTRQSEASAEFLSTDFDLEKGFVPSISVTCEEDHSDRDKNKISDLFGDKNSLQNSKRRFSSIVFTHSDEIRVLSDGENLEIASEKRERRASMSLFDTCKLACPELNQNLGNSTEHLNEMILPNSENQGKLYFMLSQNGTDKRTLEVVIIKVTNIAITKHKEFQVQLDLVGGSEQVLYSNATKCRICSGEVINFDESFNVDLEDQDPSDDEECLFLVFSLGHQDSKKSGKINNIGEIRFDLMELIEGHVLRFDGQDQFVICRNFASLNNKIRLKDNSGKVLIFLRFSKASPLNLVIGVVELKDLTSSKHFSSVNVRISLANESKVLDSRRSKVIKKKYQNAEGVLRVDESFEFNLSLPKVTLKDTACRTSTENIFLTLFICGRNNIGFSHVLGKCVIGPIDFADGTGLFHWNKGISNKGEIIYHWHSLKN